MHKYFFLGKNTMFYVILWPKGFDISILTPFACENTGKIICEIKKVFGTTNRKEKINIKSIITFL